jgi:hypothetical protein
VSAGKLSLCLSILLVVCILPADAGVLFQDDFESGSFQVGRNHPKPLWYWPDNSATNGVNAWFTVTSAPGTVHRGSYALKLNYTARNGFANNCGGTTAYQSPTHGGVTCFVIDPAKLPPGALSSDLTGNPYVGSTCGVDCKQLCQLSSGTRYLWDITRNYTRWTITGVQNADAINDRLDLAEVVPGPGYDSKVRIGSGDKCFIGRACGVDGKIIPVGTCPGMSVWRKQDNDDHILYLGGYKDPTFSWGSVQYRRFYFKFSSDYTKPSVTQKIGYWGTSDYSSFKIHGATLLMGGLTILETPAHWGPTIYKGPPFPLQTEQWYYIEEMQKAASSPTAGDGEYQIWMAPDGADPGSPLIHVQGGISLRDASGVYAWRRSRRGTNEYYLTLASGGAPNVACTTQLLMGGKVVYRGGRLGALAPGQWSYGDGDSLGYRTFYVRLGDGGNPSGKPDGYLKTFFGLYPTGMNIPGVSIWGNSQFMSKTETKTGCAYIDDVCISTERVGPVPAAPKAPEGISVTKP